MHGVYVALLGTSVIVYVGSSFNLKNRWAWHQQCHGVMEHYPTARIAYQVITEVQSMDACEARLTVLLDPWYQKLNAFPSAEERHGNYRTPLWYTRREHAVRLALALEAVHERYVLHL